MIKKYRRRPYARTPYRLRELLRVYAQEKVEAAAQALADYIDEEVMDQVLGNDIAHKEWLCSPADYHHNSHPYPMLLLRFRTSAGRQGYCYAPFTLGSVEPEKAWAALCMDSLAMMEQARVFIRSQQ